MFSLTAGVGVRALVLGALGLAALWPSPAAWAGRIGPGESLGSNDDRFFTPGDPSLAGELLAERTAQIEWMAAGFPDEVPVLLVRGLVRSRVVRAASTGTLDFYYQYLQTTESTNGADLFDVDVNGFGPFATDAAVTSSQTGAIRRSADGDVLTFDFNGEDPRSIMNFLIRTDATAFDEGGTLTADVTFPPSGIGDTATIATFRPVTDAGGPGPSPVPLPPAVWAGAAGLLGAGIVSCWHRRAAATR